jgi:uncharacterized membrane protein YbhN (UPF0104 family)
LIARILQIVVGFAISALAIFLLLKQVDIDRLGSELAKAQPLPIAIVAVCVMGSLVTRAARWQLYFLPERRVPFGPLLSTLAISYMASTFLPLRAGELVRAVFLSQRESIAVARIVGTILLEKLFDFLAIGVMLAFVVVVTPPCRSDVVEPQQPQSGCLPPDALLALRFVALVILVGFGFVVALAIWRTRTLSLLQLVEDHLPLGIGQRFGLVHAARQFAEGTDSLRSGHLWIQLLGWTTITWLFAVASSLGGAMALGVNLGPAALLFWLALTSAGQAVPSSPGYVGVYHGATVVALTSFGVDQTLAFGVALVTHAFSYGSLVVAGLVALWTGGYSVADVRSAVSGRKRAVAALAPEPRPVTPDP